MLSRLQKGISLRGMLAGLIMLSALTVSASNNYWQPVSNGVKGSQVVANKSTLTAYKLYQLNINNLRTALSGAPMRNEVSRSSNTFIDFPDADGNFQSYHVYEFSNMEAALAAAFPEIKSYVGKGINDPTSLIYFSVSPLGLQTMLIRADKPTV